MPRAIRRCCYGVALACITLLLGMTAAFGLWFMRGGRIYSVQSASMAPIFKVGDAVLVNTRIDRHKLVVGDVVTYRSQHGAAQLVSHRITNINQARMTFTVQGDSLAVADPPLAASQIVGQVWGVAPGLGRWLTWARRPPGLAALVYIPAIVVICYELRVVLTDGSKTVYRLKTHP